MPLCFIIHSRIFFFYYIMSALVDTAYSSTRVLEYSVKKNYINGANTRETVNLLEYGVAWVGGSEEPLYRCHILYELHHWRERDGSRSDASGTQCSFAVGVPTGPYQPNAEIPAARISSGACWQQLDTKSQTQPSAPNVRGGNGRRSCVYITRSDTTVGQDS